ncbi:Eco57I restriction-modification methylase domain-containing protein [Vreelandella boliviensis]|uniref:Eco57I restriction-modification methylase domain-containing protein n=1 Tax=Vreelandella boliviensis TaxID=223527 RepID=UPI001B8CDD02|nr:N-6 DNA methylase [Halomonas boliviensis]MBS3668113.1 N-6 DNA methylase [Halomonas boliviensis]
MCSRRSTTRDIAEKRLLGAYYTPERLSDILSRWAIRSCHDQILEPSFGGCGFLKSATKILTELGSQDPRQSIYGCDIDTVAFQFLAEVFESPVDLHRFLKQDFLDINEPPNWPANFDVVIGNPPYIPFQKIESEKRSELNRRIVGAGKLGGRAGLWAYFVAHSISMLKEGGRMAWVLPGAYLHANYARELRNYLSQHFVKLACYVIHERLFLNEGTDEETIILLAEGHSLEPHDVCSVSFREAKTLTELESLIESWSKTTSSRNASYERPALLNLKGKARLSYETLASTAVCKTFGDMALVNIGVVTGANDFFVLNHDQLLEKGLKPSDCDPIVAKFKQISGLEYTDNDHDSALESGFKGYLVNGFGRENNENVFAYIDTFPTERRNTTATFKKRKVWYNTGDTKMPDAFFPVMHHSGPKLVLNTMGCNSTNTIHRVYFKDSINQSKKELLCISILSSFSQISAEIVGRRYGSGVLKHEPSEAKKIAVLMPEISTEAVKLAFLKIDTALRQDDFVEAMTIADSLLASALPTGKLRDCFGLLPEALEKIRKQRRPQRYIQA